MSNNKSQIKQNKIKSLTPEIKEYVKSIYGRSYLCREIQNLNEHHQAIQEEIERLRETENKIMKKMVLSMNQMKLNLRKETIKAWAREQIKETKE